MRVVTLVGIIVVIAIAGCQADPGATGPGSTAGPGPTGAASTSGTPTAGPVATSGAPTDGPAGALPDPCTLITQEEATTAVAAPVSAGVKEGIGRPEFGTGDQCSFAATSGEGAARVGIWPNPGAEIWGVYRAGFGDVPDLPGVDADEAITSGNGLCVVLKGDVLMEVTVAAGDGYATDPEPRMIALCQAATARL